MYQQALFDIDHLASVVNVASVPQRSPFRYPGGKTWLVPRIRRWLACCERPADFIEPFAGGGIVGLTVAFEQLADHVTLVELDDDVAAVWQTILSDSGADRLASEILAFEMTHDAVVDTLAQTPGSTAEHAFQTILKNRVCHGGILAAGSGLLKHGENGRGLHSRWYPETLARRIRAIAAIRGRIAFIHGDGLNVLADHASDAQTAFFIDPPYTVPGKGKRAGSRLYTHADLDHERLFHLADTLAGPFLMTYDAADEVVDIAKRYGFQSRRIPMKNTHHAHLRELLISRDLDWVTQTSMAPTADADV